jgi:hypothetical protein
MDPPAYRPRLDVGLNRLRALDGGGVLAVFFCCFQML